MEYRFLPVKSKSLIILIFLISFYFIYMISLMRSSSNQLQQLHHYDLEDLIKLQEIRIYGGNKNQKTLEIVQPKAKCGRFPPFGELNVTDTYWQVANTSNGTFYLFNSYYDDRPTLVPASPVIRILAFISVIDPVVKTYCQLWFDGMSEPISSEVADYLALWPKYWGDNEEGASPYLITCPNPLLGLVPQFVSLVENDPCRHANNLLEIRNKRPKGYKRKFLVSVKGLDFINDITNQLVEWLEIIKIFGVDHVEIFVIEVHPNVLHVLRYYENQQFVTVKFINYPSDLPKKMDSWHQGVQNDLIPYHDTLYENLYKYEYIVPIDIDEFIVPTNIEDLTWADLMKRLISQAKKMNKEPYNSYSASNMYFLLKSAHKDETIEGIPKYMRFLSNIYRAGKFNRIGENSKSFMSMDRVLILHNHYPKVCIPNNKCRKFEIKTEDGIMAHYRSRCYQPQCLESLSNPVKDTILWKYKERILAAFNETMEKLVKHKSDTEWMPSYSEGYDASYT